MRKIVLTLLIAVAVVACAKPRQYVIDGHVDPKWNGMPVFMRIFENGMETDVMTTVEDGRFEFRGEEDTTRTALIYLGGLWMRFEYGASVFREHDTVRVTLGGGSTVGGTPLNDILQSGREIEKNNGHLSPEHIAFTKDNIRNAAGQHSLNGFYTQISDGLFADFVAAAPELFEKGGRLELFPVSRENQRSIPEKENRREALIGTPYRDFEFKDPEGGVRRLSEYVGKYELLVIDVWASWCKPCIEGMPQMHRIYEKYASRGVGMLGISVDNDTMKGAWLKQVKKLDVPWEQLATLAEKGSSEFEKHYVVADIPYAIVIDREGIIAALVRLPVDFHSEEGRLEPLLKKLLDK